MRQHKIKKIGVVGEALIELFSRYPVTALVTLSWPSRVHEGQEIPERFEMSVGRLVEAIATHCEEGIGCIGLLVPTSNGRLHAHFMLLKESGKKFTAKEFARINRARRADTKAEPIRTRKELYAYIASQHHLPNATRRYITLAFGEDILKASEQTP